MSLEQYNEFKERVHNRISERFHTTYTNHDFEVDGSDVQILYTWKHDIAGSEIHAVCCHKVDADQKRLFVTGVRFSNNFPNYEDYELSDIGLFPNSRAPNNAIVFKIKNCRVYVISFDAEIRVYSITEQGNTVITSMPHTGRSIVKMLIPQPVDVLKRVENNLMYFWVGYENNGIDLMSFKTSLLAQDSIRSFKSIIDFNGGTLINIEIRDSILGVSTFAAFTYLEIDRYQRNGSTISVVAIDTRMVLSYCEKLRRADNSATVPKMLTSLCPFRISVPIHSDESLISTSIDQSSIHAIPSIFDYNVTSTYSYTVTIEYSYGVVARHLDATNVNKINRRFTTAQQKIVDTMIKFGPRIFENPEEPILFAPDTNETVMDFMGIQHTLNENEISSGHVSKPLWELCMQMAILRPDRKVKFEKIFAEKLDDPSYSASRTKRIRASFYRMVVLEAAITLGLSGLIAKYILDQDSSLSTALLASSPYVLKDISKLHNWLLDLEEHMIADTTTLIGHFISPLLGTKGVHYFDVPISYSAQLNSNSIMCSGIKLVLNSLIQRVSISSHGNFGVIWNKNNGYSQSDKVDGIQRDNSEMLDELAEMECLGRIIRATHLMISDPQCSLKAMLPIDETPVNDRKMSEVGFLHSQRIQNHENTLVFSAIPVAARTSNKLCFHYLLENMYSVDNIIQNFDLPPLYSVSANDDSDEVWQAITDMIMLPLSSLRSNRRSDQTRKENQQEVSKIVFIALAYVMMDCMQLSPLFDTEKPTHMQIRSLEEFTTQFARACGIDNFSNIVISVWKIDAGIDDPLISMSFEQMDSSILPRTIVVNALKMLMTLESWEIAQELLHSHFKELYTIDAELAFSFMSSVHLRNNPLNWRESLDNCQTHLNYVCGDEEITPITVKSEQYKKIMTDLVRNHIDLLFNNVSFDCSISNLATNSLEREIWTNVLSEKVNDIFGEMHSNAEQSLACLSDSQSTQFKSINMYIAQLLSLLKTDEAYKVDKIHRDYIKNSLLDNSTQSMLSERLKLIHNFGQNV